MNLLEYYIEEIYNENYLTYKGKEIVKVKWKYDCYGIIEIAEDVFFKNEWEEAKKKGYIML